jgi:hypothetical protein
MVEGEGAALWSRVGDLVIECAEWESGEREGYGVGENVNAPGGRPKPDIVGSGGVVAVGKALFGPGACVVAANWWEPWDSYFHYGEQSRMSTAQNKAVVRVRSLMKHLL